MSVNFHFESWAQSCLSMRCYPRHPDAVCKYGEVESSETFQKMALAQINEIFPISLEIVALFVFTDFFLFIFSTNQQDRVFLPWWNDGGIYSRGSCWRRGCGDLRCNFINSRRWQLWLLYTQKTTGAKGKSLHRQSDAVFSAPMWLTDAQNQDCIFFPSSSIPRDGV